MKWSTFLKEYFTFTRKERIGLLVIVAIIIGIWIFPQLTYCGNAKLVSPDTSWIAAAKKLQRNHDSSGNILKSNDENIDDLVYDKSVEKIQDFKSELFYFDPNTLSFDGWKKLGLREKTITTIQKYLNKGGHFDSSEDLKRIYGIHVDEYNRLRPYIKIEANHKKDLAALSKNEFRKGESASKNSKYQSVDINVADTSAFISLPGIGNKLASRIVNFRDRLGGFYSIDQISETYGLPDSAFQKIKTYLRVDNTLLKQISINTATKDEMKSHPYIKWNLANAIVEYRNQHGNFTSLEDLKKITLVSDQVFEKIKFYLKL